MISAQALSLIKDFEGLRLTSYKCPAGVFTIGYGSTGRDVVEGSAWTEADATRRLIIDCAYYENAILSKLTVPVESYELDAMVCLAYNVGFGNFRNSTLLKKVNLKELKLAAAEFLRWNKVKGKVLKGLDLRRRAEQLLFMTGKYTSKT